MISQKGPYFAAGFCLLIEIGSVSFLRKPFGIYLSPVLFITSGLALVFFLLKIQKHQPVSLINSRTAIARHLIPGLFFGVLVIAGWLALRSFFSEYPIDPAKSDIIPLVQVMVDRYLDGSVVYSTINSFGYEMYPNYLPMTWLPFTAAEWLHLDYRTWSYIIFTCCITPVLFIRHLDMPKKMMILLVVFGVFFFYLFNQPVAFGWTIEPMITGFYLLFLLALYKKNILLLALSLVCCLLSRYALLLALPFMFLVFFFFISRKQTGLISLLTLAGVMGIFVIPFLISQPDILNKSYDYYTAGALAEWRGQSWQSPGDMPYQLSQAHGFAIFFYDRNHLEAGLGNLQRTHIAISILVAAVFTGWYFLKGKRWLAAPGFLMLLLHIYLVFFFAFIQVPYAYLYFTPVMISVLTTLLLTVGNRS